MAIGSAVAVLTGSTASDAPRSNEAGRRMTHPTLEAGARGRWTQMECRGRQSVASDGNVIPRHELSAVTRKRSPVSPGAKDAFWQTLRIGEGDQDVLSGVRPTRIS
jgi:hypothetical protein